MLVIGAKGFAKEILQILHQKNELKNLVFYDDLNKDIGSHLYNRFKILKSNEEASNYFKTIDNRFTIGIGSPELRRRMYHQFIDLGGVVISTISLNASIGDYENTIYEGCNIMAKVSLTNSITIKKGTIINQLTSIGHDVVIGSFCEICPNVSVSGNCLIGDGVFVGSGAIILPYIKIGNNAVIGAGSVVTKNIPDNSVAFGAPARVVRKNM